MTNTNNQLPDEVFQRGDYVQPEGESAIVLVTGWTNTTENFRGVVVESPVDGKFPLRLGEYSETWHTRKFKKVEYATKLLQAQQEKEEERRQRVYLEMENDVITDNYNKAQQEIESLTNQLKKQNEVQDQNMKHLVNSYKELEEENKENYKAHKEARALLEKFISRHEAGLLPDRFIYNEIKTFLGK